MHWEKKICIRLTLRRIMGMVLVASTIANLVIVGVVFGATSSTPTPTTTSISPTQSTTFTPVFPSATKTETFTPIPSSPTFTALPTNTPTDVPTLSLCILKSDWPVYHAQWGDSLFSIASSIGSSVEELMQANCLLAEPILPGQLLYLPRLPVTPTFTPSITPTNTPSSTPTDTPTATVTAIPDVPTDFQYPSGTYSICASVPDVLDASVIPIDPQGIGSLTAFYSINGDSWSELPMQPDGNTYNGSIFLSSKYETVDTVNFYFLAYDSLRNRTESTKYKASITSCPAIQQSN